MSLDEIKLLADIPLQIHFRDELDLRGIMAADFGDEKLFDASCEASEILFYVEHKQHDQYTLNRNRLVKLANGLEVRARTMLMEMLQILWSDIDINHQDRLRDLNLEPTH
jgi:hypothetical protein